MLWGPHTSISIKSLRSSCREIPPVTTDPCAQGALLQRACQAHLIVALGVFGGGGCLCVTGAVGVGFSEGVP